MSKFIVKWVANRFLKDNQLNRFGVEDPYYENVVVGQTKDGQPKYKKIVRRVPDNISHNDKVILAKVKQQAYRYDLWFSALGMRFGLSSLVGLVPIVGSIVTTYWSLLLFMNARSLDDGLPLDIQLLFLFNILVDFLLSLIPIIGDIIEVGYKANLRNFLLLEKHLVRVGQKNAGIISADEVRPGFINDKVQPFVDETLVPNTVKAGEQIKKLVSNKLRAGASTTTSSETANPTIEPSLAVATGTIDTFADDDNRSIRSLTEVREKAD
ncbi:hypothetical protein PUMCH_004879 [Australozyma saopauloensis]|uniref:Uncharacterized protein n=1 Tax=Australozyma saopauloensis TaxID=291208 RepID=A0AAX4HFV7_9ASCO|nr:hypothetical protein PUMCH_004879 [[Candida] saopauloensis]